MSRLVMSFVGRAAQIRKPSRPCTSGGMAPVATTETQSSARKVNVRRMFPATPPGGGLPPLARDQHPLAGVGELDVVLGLRPGASVV